MTATDEDTAPEQGTLSAADAGAGAPDMHEALLAPLGTRFEHVRVLGRGAMGVVHLARDGELDRLVAIKRIAVSAPVAGSRLQREARLAAKIEHRNVVAVYDVSIADDAIYIISEYIEGKGLHQVETPVPWAKALAWGLDLARGLAAAHARGVLHRDIKPANTILDERTQQAKLIDFGVATLVDDGTRKRARADDPLRAATEPSGGPVSGRAVDVDEATDTGSTGTPPGARPGTPRYQAPEIWDGQPASTRTDVYALGALLYELCTGQKPHVMADPDTRDAMRIEDEDVDPRFAHLVNRCLDFDPARRPASGKELAEALAEVHAAPVAPENPYRGLLCFHERHRGVFFGRELDTARIIERARAEPFLLLVGESGVGKSSLGHAGVLPRLRHELDPGQAWTIHAMVPGRRPLTALRRALSQRDETGLVLFIDQLEELLTVSEPDEAHGAQALLARLVAGNGQDAPGGPRLDSVRVLAAVRGDYLTRLAEMPELGGLLEKHIYLVRALDPAGIRAAIVQPARKTGVTFESDELVAELQQATMRARGGMPLLQFALAELWAARDVARGVITRQSLDEIGGVAGALARYADAVLAELPRREQLAAAQRILTRLVAVHHRTRIRCTRRDLVGEEVVGQEVLERLVDRRLVVCHLAEGEWVYSIAHEALLTAWPTLRGWLDRESELVTLRGHLADAAQQWQALERSNEALWGQRLARAAERIDVGELSSNEAAFLAASQRALWRARWLVRGVVLAVIVLGTGIFTGSRELVRRELVSTVDRHLSDAREALTDASTLRKAYSDVRRQVDAKLRAGEDDWTASWERALALDPRVIDAYRKASQAAEAAYALDAGRDDVKAQLAQALEERAWFADATGRHEDREDLVERLAVIDAKRAEPWQALIPVAVTTTPGGGTVEIRQYIWQPAAPFENELFDMAEAPFDVELPPGSYLAIVQASEGHAEVRYPLEIRPRRERDAPEEISIYRPRAEDVPDGFVYVSEGEFWSGYGQTPEQEGYRVWHEASPLHLVHSDAYLIGEHEITYREWLEYVDDCAWRPCPGGAPARAIVAQNEDFLLEVRHEPGRGWQIHWKPDPTQDGYRATAGGNLVYEAREHLRSQYWLEFPVSGLSWFEVQRYLEWLREVRGVRGADLCTEAQWERAARGADARLYPHGNGIAGGDANIDKSYGQVPGAFGPDAVDAHPQNESPFGLLDMAGNVAEMTRPVQGETAGGEQPVVVRGGAFYITAIDARVFSRWDITRDQSSALVGFRVCAAAPRE